MDEKPQRRPATPKRFGPNTIVRDKDLDETLKAIRDQELRDSLRSQDVQSKGRLAKRDKSPKRPQTPKREQAVRNAVILDENTEEVVRKYLETHDSVHPQELPRREVSGAKPKKGKVTLPPSPTTKGTTKPIEEIKKADPKYTVPEALLTVATVGTAAFPAANTAEPRIVEDPGTSGFFRRLSGRFRRKKSNKEEPVVSDLSTTDPSVHTSHYSTSLPSELFEDRLSETYTPSTVTPALDMTSSRLARLTEEGDTLSDSFPSEVVEEGAVGGMEREFKGRIQKEGTLLSSPGKPAFTEQVDEPVKEQSDRGRLLPVAVDMDIYDNPDDDDNERRPSRIVKYKVWCQGNGKSDRPQSTSAGKSKTYSSSGDRDAQTPDDNYYDYYHLRYRKRVAPKNVGERKEDSGWGGEDSSPRGSGLFSLFDELRVEDWGDLIGPYDDETLPWVYHEKYFRRRRSSSEREQKGGPEMDDDVKKGVLKTPDGDFDVDYVKKRNDEVVVMKAVPASGMEKFPRGMKRNLTPREELLKPSDKPRAHSRIKEVEIDRSSCSDSESEGECPGRSISSQRPVAESSTCATCAGFQEYSRSRSSSDASSDSDTELDY